MKLGRNEPCHCGSGKKYKHCHYEEDRAAETAELKQAAEERAALLPPRSRRTSRPMQTSPAPTTPARPVPEKRAVATVHAFYASQAVAAQGQPAPPAVRHGPVAAHNAATDTGRYRSGFSCDSDNSALFRYIR